MSPSHEKYLIITADDFGASVNINEGIKLAAESKAVSTVSVMTNFTGSHAELTDIAGTYPEIGIGVHLNITTGKPILPYQQIRSLVNDEGNFFNIEQLLPNIKKITAADLKNELRAQILVLNELGIKPDHISDQHGILSFYTPFFNILTELAREFGLPMRSPVLAGIKYQNIFGRAPMQKHARRLSWRLAFGNPIKALGLIKYSRLNWMEEKSMILDGLGIPHPDVMIECFWGDPTPENLLFILEHLPEGISEIILHLGTYFRQDIYPNGLDLEYFRNREKELMTITSRYLKEYYKYLNIKVIKYRDITGIVRSKKKSNTSQYDEIKIV